MSSVESWKDADQDYSLRELYDFIVALLSTPDSVFAKNTLKWWNRKVFGLKNTKAKRVSHQDVIPATSRFNRLLAAENARSQRKSLKAEERRQHEEAERRAAEATAKRKAYEDLRADRERRRRRKEVLEKDADETGVTDEGSSADEGNDMSSGEGGEGEVIGMDWVNEGEDSDGLEDDDEVTQDIHEDTRARR
ncbi:hypothetical protein K435DRAFT_497118 [Dendrothele bispora CBS 962.96]|uniref:ETS domain-containing protein n=1 Tax=Dendrothele bispora (strain CBS 962.96) TaxID=1314807 RepID=A0A4S8KX02_DENBC|nr:hypothetical protein K435DRAFT_497118 [Dendrothele bispora CBS 962.96]